MTASKILSFPGSGKGKNSGGVGFFFFPGRIGGEKTAACVSLFWTKVSLLLHK